MTDAHCHVSAGDASVREFLIGRDFVGVHPWEVLANPPIIENLSDRLRTRLTAEPRLGVGEIGLDRLREREISPAMRTAFETQLALAAKLVRPVVLHGAKCWGQVVAAVKTLATPPPGLLFHGFSRSDGLIPEIITLGGFISVGPAVLNDHAVNYRALVKKIPIDRLLVETDRTDENAATCPPVGDVLAKTAEILGVSVDALERQTDANAAILMRCAVITSQILMPNI